MIVDGQYRFVGVPPGDYQVSHIGRSAGIHVEPGVTVTGDITRSP
jgi:protocatechuate 3,4-dioxygenase beta subunit